MLWAILLTEINYLFSVRRGSTSSPIALPIRRLMDIAIESMKPEDWPEMQRIYREGIATGHATFTTEAPEWEAWDNGHLKDCRLVARMDSKSVGWAALSAVSSRCVYAGVAEVSVYIGSESRGQGIGKKLLHRLIEDSERHNIWMLQAGIFPENTASIATHKACGFREVGRRERLGKMNDTWRDILFLERRSKVVGQ